MISLMIKKIVKLVNGKAYHIENDNMQIDAVGIDSRKIEKNMLFIALKGENFDGHAFVEQAIKAGAVVVIVNQKVTNCPHLIPQIVVQDTRLALGQIAAYVRSQMTAKVLALTGSSGKTSVKEMTAAILQNCGQTLYTQGNFNNDIGVPLTLLRLTPNDQFAVIELGANHIGEIAYTTALVKPQTALINNISQAHIEGFGSLAGVAKAKGEIFTGLTANGIAIVNLDSCSDEWFTQFDRKNSRNKNSSPKNGQKYPRLWTFSLRNPTADFYASHIIDIDLNADAKRASTQKRMTTFTLHTPQGECVIELPLVGQHNVTNAIAAAALAMSVNADFADIQCGLAQLQPVKGRLYPIRLNAHQLILDDAYNANVGSMTAAISVLAKQSGYKVLVVGDMAELGEQAAEYHQQIGELAKQAQLDCVVSVGNLSQFISQFSGVGHHFADKQSAVHFLATLLRQHKMLTMLVKGSRSARMEEVIEQLLSKVSVNNQG